MAPPNSKRGPSPTSPSPSPEPAGGQQASASTSRPLAFQQPSLDYSNLANASGSSSSAPTLGHPSASQVPFHELLAHHLPPGGSEGLRQQLEEGTRNVIDTLYQLAVCAADVQRGREDIVGVKVNEVISSLAHLSSLSSHPSSIDLPQIPEEVLGLVDEGKNPDAWSKTRMSRLVSDNQQLAGQRWAVERYREKLGREVSELFPELSEEVERMGKEEKMSLRDRDGMIPSMLSDGQREIEQEQQRQQPEEDIKREEMVQPS